MWILALLAFIVGHSNDFATYPRIFLELGLPFIHNWQLQLQNHHYQITEYQIPFATSTGPLLCLWDPLPALLNNMETLPIVLGSLIAVLFLIGLASLINISMRKQNGPTTYVWNFDTSCGTKPWNASTNLSLQPKSHHSLRCVRLPVSPPSPPSSKTDESTFHIPQPANEMQAMTLIYWILSCLSFQHSIFMGGSMGGLWSWS